MADKTVHPLTVRVIALTALIWAVCVQDASAQTTGATGALPASVLTATATEVISTGATEISGTSTPDSADTSATDITTQQPGAPDSGTSSTPEAADDGDNSTASQPSITPPAATSDDQSGTSSLPSGMSSEGGTQSPHDGTTGKAGIECYSCLATNTTGDCYGAQSDSNQKTCGVGEKCWTIRFNQDGEFVNLTRGCSTEECKDTHSSPDARSCDEMQDVEICSQCCEESLCNKYENAGGRGLSACLSGVVLSVVAAVGLVNP